MLATIRDDTWNVLSMQYVIPNSKRWDYSDIPVSGHKQNCKKQRKRFGTFVYKVLHY